MGLINNDVYVASNGVEKVGTYISFATETLYLRQAGQGGSSYSVNANYRVYWDQECRDTGKSFLDLKSVSANLTADQLSGNLYEALYDALKLIYPNTRTAPVAHVAPSEPAPVAPSEPAPVGPAEPAPVAPAEPAPVAPSEPAPVAPSEPAPVSSENVVVNP